MTEKKLIGHRVVTSLKKDTRMYVTRQNGYVVQSFDRPPALSLKKAQKLLREWNHRWAGGPPGHIIRVVKKNKAQLRDAIKNWKALPLKYREAVVSHLMEEGDNWLSNNSAYGNEMEKAYDALVNVIDAL